MQADHSNLWKSCLQSTRGLSGQSEADCSLADSIQKPNLIVPQHTINKPPIRLNAIRRFVGKRVQ